VFYRTRRLRSFDLNVESLEPSKLRSNIDDRRDASRREMDHCFASIAQALTDGGYLWLNDYVGPARFQWSDTHIRLASELLAIVPEKWRIGVPSSSVILMRSGKWTRPKPLRPIKRGRSLRPFRSPGDI
jgi:hypothetical protein